MTKSTAVTTQSNAISAAELTTLLQGAGMAEKQSASANRLKFTNSMLVASDTGEMWGYNARRPEIPMMTCRLLNIPDEYFVIWIDETMVATLGLPISLVGKPSRKYVHPDPERQTWESDEYFDQLKQAGAKSSWSADLELQIIPEDGALKGDETVYTLTLSTTSLIEFKGTSRAPAEGAVSPENFIQKLAHFAMEQVIEEKPDATKADIEKAVLDAMTSLRLGGVAAEARPLPMENKELARSWTIISFTPIHIEPLNEAPALTDGTETEDVPF